MKLSVNEAKLTGLWTTFAFGTKKLVTEPSFEKRAP